MSSHGRTPARVLAAPTLTPVLVSAQTGRLYLIPRDQRDAATNEPFLRDQSFRRRGNKARRHARRRTARGT